MIEDRDIDVTMQLMSNNANHIFVLCSLESSSEFNGVEVGCTMPREFKSVQGPKVVQILESSVSTSFSLYDLDLGVSCLLPSGAALLRHLACSMQLAWLRPSVRRSEREVASSTVAWVRCLIGKLGSGGARFHREDDCQRVAPAILAILALHTLGFRLS